MEIINKNSLLNIFQESFKNLYEFDCDLINKNIHEQCLSGRLAMYIREHFDEKKHTRIRVDIEYNRDKNNQKCENQNIEYDAANNPHIRPDILIHERGTDNYNILYCEIKKNSDNDVKKVEKQVNINREYVFGICITKIDLSEINFILFEHEKNKEYEEYCFKKDSGNIKLVKQCRIIEKSY